MKSFSVEATPSHEVPSQGSTTMGFIQAASSVTMHCVGGSGGRACHTDNASC